jgi:hypothetical protein
LWWDMYSDIPFTRIILFSCSSDNHHF